MFESPKSTILIVLQSCDVSYNFYATNHGKQLLNSAAKRDSIKISDNEKASVSSKAPSKQSLGHGKLQPASPDELALGEDSVAATMDEREYNIMMVDGTIDNFTLAQLSPQKGVNMD